MTNSNWTKFANFILKLIKLDNIFEIETKIKIELLKNSFFLQIKETNLNNIENFKYFETIELLAIIYCKIEITIKTNYLNKVSSIITFTFKVLQLILLFVEK